MNFHLKKVNTSDIEVSKHQNGVTFSTMINGKVFRRTYQYGQATAIRFYLKECMIQLNPSFFNGSEVL